MPTSASPKDFADLKARLKPICQRTLRRQVLEYVPFTNRHALVQEFYPTPEEQRLYDLVSEYLQRPTLFALPASQRKLMTLILRRLLASSTHAISATLDALANKLDVVAQTHAAAGLQPEEAAPDYETLDELKEEWEDGEEEQPTDQDRPYSPEELAQMREESDSLKEFHRLARSIVKNSKGEVLLTALKRGFEEALKKGANKKAIIFTESIRTQSYAPSETLYWQQGHSSENSSIYVTTQHLTREQLTQLNDEVGPGRGLLICCGAFRGKPEHYPHLEIKKIPKAVLAKCEWGHDDYSLKIENLPKAPPKPGQIELI